MSGPPGPRYSAALFDRMLAFRGISRERALLDPNPLTRHSGIFLVFVPEQPTAYDEDLADISYGCTSPAELLVDPDRFYTPRHEPQDPAFCDKYTSTHGVSDRRYSNNCERMLDSERLLYNESEAELREAYSLWEQHDEHTLAEIAPENLDDESALMDGELTANGGVYDPYRPELSELNAHQITQLVTLPPAAKYRDLLELSFWTRVQLHGLSQPRRYKNNLSAIVRHQSEDFLVVANLSEILVYDFHPTWLEPLCKPCLRFETRPPVTLTLDRIVLTLPCYPHAINYVKASSYWAGGSVVGICVDDGSLHIWRAETLAKHIKLHKDKLRKSLYSLKIKPDLTLKTSASAWGLDFAKTIDADGAPHHILVASSNSQTAALFYVNEALDQWSEIETHETLHNIPSVSFIEYSIADSKHRATVSCVTISGELLIFEFVFNVEKERRVVSFETPRVIRRTCLDSDCWTAKPVHSKYFKSVQSIRAMTGDPIIDELNEAAKILTESKILGASDNSPSHLGIACCWQYYEPPVVKVNLKSAIDEDDLSNPKYLSLQEECWRMHETYKHKSMAKQNGAEDDIFLAVSTDKTVGLFRADTLFCTALTGRLFGLELATDEDSKFCNRILISEVIPELLCFIAVTQLGFVSIMRLCEHRGLHSMRQEHIFPNALGLMIGGNGFRSIVGMCVRDISILAESPRFQLFIIYSDGFTLPYTLWDSDGNIEVSGLDM